jgi:hypothetical protein
MTTTTRRAWLVPTGLIMLSLLPVFASAFRVGKLSAGEVEPEDAHFYANPVPILIHVCAASVYLILGALQFSPGLRRRRWHRMSGRLVIPAGIAAASAGLWMVLFYPRPPVFGERLLAVVQIGVATSWILFLLLGFAAIRAREITRHRVWMIRAYALGSGTGTQVFTLLPFSVDGELSHLATALLMFAGWAINIVVAEWIIRKDRVPNQLIPVLETR